MMDAIPSKNKARRKGKLIDISEMFDYFKVLCFAIHILIPVQLWPLSPFFCCYVSWTIFDGDCTFLFHHSEFYLKLKLHLHWNAYLEGSVSGIWVVRANVIAEIRARLGRAGVCSAERLPWKLWFNWAQSEFTSIWIRIPLGSRAPSGAQRGSISERVLSHACTQMVRERLMRQKVISRREKIN